MIAIGTMDIMFWVGFSLAVPGALLFFCYGTYQCLRLLGNGAAFSLWTILAMLGTGMMLIAALSCAA
jgi:hypothetical protein